MKKILTFVLILGIFSCILCGCAEMPPVTEYEYELSMVRYTEMTGEHGFVTYMEKTETDEADFYFEKTISVTERTACIWATQEILRTVPTTEKLAVYLFAEETYGDVRVENNALYLSPRDFESPDYATNVLLGICGEYCNFGAAYGLANHLCRTLFGTGVKTVKFPMDAAFYDLNLLCFDLNFVSETDVEKSKAIAVSFANDYIKKHGEAAYIGLLKASGNLDTMAQFSTRLESFYMAKGVDYDVTDLLFASGGVYMDYRILSPYATFHVTKDWQDSFYEVSWLLHDNFLHENYEETKRFFEINVEQMGKYQAFLGLEEYNNDLAILFGGADTSWYANRTHQIYITAISSLTHEYIHSLTLWRGNDCFRNEAWAAEGLADCLRHEYDDYGVSILNALYNSYTADDEGADFVLRYKDMIERDIDFAIDRDLMDFCVYARNQTHPDQSTAAQESFMRYLVTTYGKDAAIGYVCKKNGEYVELGKNFDALVQDWLLWIQEKYNLFQ